MTIPPGEFDDITLINPRTAGELEDAARWWAFAFGSMGEVFHAHLHYLV
jgi:hypothetical protein